MTLAVADPSILKSNYILPSDYEIMTETAEVFTKALLLGMMPDAGGNFADMEPVEVLPFEEAVAYMQKRLPVDRDAYYSLADKMRYRAFTVGRLADGDTVQRVQTMLVKAMEEGTGLQQFLKLTEGQLADAAGIGRGVGWYYETVYRTNTATAYNVGRAIGFEETPPVALELIGIDDMRQTEICHSLTVPPLRKPYDDPVWDRLWPPFHFNCRTTVRGIYDQSEIDEAGGPGKFYSKGTPGFTPAEGFGVYPLDKSDAWWDLTDAMRKRAEEYGLTDEFEKAKELLIDTIDNKPINVQTSSDKLLDTKSIDDLENFAREELGVKTVNLQGLDVNAVKGTFEAMVETLEEYPILKGQITEIAQDKGGILTTTMNKDFSGFTLTINPHYYADIKNIKTAYAKGLAKIPPDYPVGTNWMNPGVHELGHVAHGVVAKYKSNYQYDWQALLDWNDSTTTTRIVNEAWKNVKNDYPKGTNILNARREISKYAANSYDETVAEAFSDIFSNKVNARPLSREIVRILKELLI